MVYCYEYNNKEKVLNRTEEFEPNETNWLVKAERDGNSFYFTSLAAYNAWAGTTCPVSAHFINRVGLYRGYRLTKNY